jgi:hypothetical protein
MVGFDVEGYAKQTDPERVAVRQAAFRVLDEAFHDAGIDRRSCDVQDRGDGILFLVPADVPKTQLLNRLPGSLVHHLNEHNRGRARRLRMRAAFHAGEVIRTDRGYVGGALNPPTALLTSAQLRTVQQVADTDLVVAVTETFYRAVVEAGPADTGPSRYRRVVVESDGNSGPAWIHIPVEAPTATPSDCPRVPGPLGVDDLHHRGIFIVDIADSGSRRDDVKRLHRAKLREMVLGAICDVAIAPDQCGEPTDTGDGLRVLFAPEVSKNRLAGPMVSALFARLTRYNATVAGIARMQLRSVLSAGELRRDDYDYLGSALNEVYWLLDSDVLRTCLGDSDMVFMVSDGIFENVVRHGYLDIDPHSYEPRRVSLKNRDVHTWVSWPDLWERGR